MKPLEFLAAVLPSPGHGLYCAVELSSTRKEHRFVSNLADVRPDVKRWLSKNRDIYFALATFKNEAGGRKAENAQFVKSIFMDMDGYATKREAVVALSGFLERTGLNEFGQPYIVSSGGGIHCYWPLTEEADVLTWKPIAENFKRLCAQEKLVIDNTVTADAARVLRIPGTLNFKKKYSEPRAVKLLLEGTGAMDLKRFGATVRAQLRDEFAPASNAFLASAVQIAGVRPSRARDVQTKVSESLMANSATRFEPIWMKSEQGVGCGQVSFFMHNAQQDGMEPLWRGLLSWVKVCDDSAEYAHKLSELHPYDAARTQQKLAEVKGPYPCVKMDSENPGVCPKCPFWGNVTNALALGREVKTDNRARAVTLPLPDTGDATDDRQEHAGVSDGLDGNYEDDTTPTNVRTHTVMRPTPPRHFSYGAFGGVYKDVKEKDATGVEIKTQVQVLPYDMFVVDMLRMDEKEHHVHLVATRKDSVSTVIMPSRAVVSKDEMLKCLASNNIYASFGQACDQHLFTYVRACVEEAALLKRAVDVPIQFGWQKDRSFVYNTRVFHADGSETAVPMPGLENLNKITCSKGTVEGWRKPWELLIARKMHTMLALCADSFGSTLMHFSDYEGFVWHIGSTGSGTGKSLTLSLKAGVWGHPVRYRTGKGTSHVAMQQRAGLLNSMPLLIDEITGKTRNDTEWAPEFIFNISEGQGKERMESGTNKERVNNSTWALTCTMTSNTHMVDLLTGARKHSSHGEMMRMLEWTPTTQLEFNAAERQVLKDMRCNYGVAGEKWVQWLVTNYETAKTMWGKVHDKLRTEIGFTDEERYWHAACASAVTAAILLGPKYADLITLPVAAIVSAFRDLVEGARESHKGSVRTAEDVLNAYVREFYGKFVVIRKDAAGKLLAELGQDMAGKTSTRSVVMGRIEHGTRHAGFVEFYVEEALLKQHCASMSFGYADFKRQLAGMRGEGYDVDYCRKDLLARTDGPSMRVNCMRVSVPKEKFDESELSVGAD